MTTRTKAELVAIPVLLIIGVAGGHFATPAKVVEHTVTQVATKVVYQDRIVTQTVAAKAATADKQEITTKIIYRSGPVQERDVVRYVDKVTTQTVTIHDKSEVVAATQTTQTKIDTSKVTVNEASQWSVFAGVGVELSVKPLGAAPIYEVGVERRLVGPLSAGVFGSLNQSMPTQPTFGAVISLEF